MKAKRRGLTWALLCATGLLCAGSVGCCSCRPCSHAPADAPRELAKFSLPAYIIEPPDILLLDTVRVVPLPPYHIDPLDALFIQSTGTLATDPINGVFSVDPDGTVNLGVNYGGAIRVVGMTIEEARDAIEKHLAKSIKEPKVQVSLAQSRALQQIRGEHLVRPDGTIGLGVYGSVYVAGKTIEEGKAEIEAHLSQYLLNPEISLDVFAYNSKVYYVVIDGGGYGEQVVRLPIYGNETVLDALANINGLPTVSSKYHIWVSRPGHDCGDQVLPVDWPAIVKCGASATNYQLFPGDRIYVKADALITTDNWLAKAISPIERLFGVTLLGNVTVRSFRTNNGNSNGTGGNGFGGF
jgi:polysaccharide export outer membrane protein